MTLKQLSDTAYNVYMAKYNCTNSTQLKYELLEALNKLAVMYLELKTAVAGKEKLEHEETVIYAKKLKQSKG